MTKPKQPKKQPIKKKKPRRRPIARPVNNNRNVINIGYAGGGSGGAIIPIDRFSRFDTSPAIETRVDNTFALIENQRKQLDLFKTDIVSQQNANLKTLTESWNNNLALTVDTLQNKLEQSTNEKLNSYEENLSSNFEVLDNKINKDVISLKQLALEYLPKNKTTIFNDTSVQKPLMLDEAPVRKPLMLYDKPVQKPLIEDVEFKDIYKENRNNFDTPNMKYVTNPMKLKQPAIDTINESPKKLVGLPEISNDSKTDNCDIFEDFLKSKPVEAFKPVKPAKAVKNNL